MTKRSPLSMEMDAGEYKSKIVLPRALGIVRASPDYRVLQRIKYEMLPDEPLSANHAFAIYLDVETTGLDTDRAEIIELAMIPFVYCTKTRKVLRMHAGYHAYNEPAVPISEEITKLTGITNDMVKGHRIDWQEVLNRTRDYPMVIAHSAQFDRRMLERYCSEFQLKRWHCTVEQVPWLAEGISSRKLEHIAASLGYFYDAHNAESDVVAALFCITRPLPGTDRTAFSYLLDHDEARHIWAINAPFHAKDALKARGYTWCAGPPEMKMPKAWNKEASMATYIEECKWLNDTVYRGTARQWAKVVKVSPLNRFTDRIAP